MTIGEIIKSRREELGASLEDVCHGICSESMLYKVEGGTKSFKPETLALILERLGMHIVFDGELITTNDYRYVQTIKQANKMILVGNTEKADEMLSDIQVDYERFSVSTKQRFDMCETLLVEKTVGMSHEQKLDSFEKIIRYTIENFSPLKPPCYFTDSEIRALNVIANCYYYISDLDTGIVILRHLKKYAEEILIDKNYAAHFETIVCNNLSEMLLQCGNYDDAIEIAKDGIRWAKTTNVINEVASGCMYNYAVGLLKRGNKEDIEQARQMAFDAYYTCKVYNIFPKYTKMFKEFYDKNFH